MLTVSGLEDQIVNLTDHANLTTSRLRTWINMVSYEMAARLAGSDVTGMAVSPVAVWTAAVSVTTGVVAWAGAYVQTGTVGAASEWPAVAANTGMLFPQDALYVHQIFHGSTAGTSLMNATGVTGIFNQRYQRVEVGDLCRFVNGMPASSSISSGNVVDSIFYADVGAIFASDNASQYAPLFMVFPNPQAASNGYALVEYVPAPTQFSNSSGDDGKSNVYMSKYPDVFLNGVLRYAWLYLGRVEDYMRSKKAWEDGLTKLAAVSRSFAHMTRVGGVADHEDLRYLGR